MTILPPKITSPMRLMSIEQEFRDSFPVWLYTFKIDAEQSQRMVRDWDRTQPSEYIVFDEFKFVTETQLPLGVGDLFTPDLVPYDPIPENDEERVQREARERLMEQIHRTGRFAQAFMIPVEDPDDQLG